VLFLDRACVLDNRQTPASLADHVFDSSVRSRDPVASLGETMKARL
jgi:hypothetical protein